MSINLKLISKPINYKLEKSLRKYLINIQNYEKLNNENLNKIKKKIKKLNNHLITVNMILSMRSSYLKTFLIINYKNLNKNVIEEYNKTKLILPLSKKLNLSPMTVFRYILKSKPNYKIILKNPSIYLNKIDLKQFKLAVNNDIIAPLNQDKILKYSIEFEEKIQKFLEYHKIKFKTQNQLIKEHSKITPDFYIQSKLFINNIRINWIDAKNYYGANTFLIKKNIKKQTKKYLNKMGNGCLIFSQGFSSKLSFKNILLLDSRQITFYH